MAQGCGGGGVGDLVKLTIGIPVLGSPSIRVAALWGLHCNAPIHGNYHFGLNGSEGLELGM